MTIQQKKLEITILTRANEPLEIYPHVLKLIEEAVHRAVSSNVDLRYWPESRYVEERHEYLGVSLKEA